MWLVHRLMYGFTNGDPGELQVDHTCRHPACCNPQHLRAVTNKQNGENRNGPYSNNKSTGVRNVYPTPEGRFRARIKHNGRIIHLGHFDTVEAAEHAAIAARTEIFTHSPD